MRVFIILVLLLSINTLVHGQDNEDFYNNCNFHGQVIDSNNYKLYIQAIDSLAYELSNEKMLTLVNCLIALDSSKPELYWYRAQFLFGSNIYDTSYLKAFRKCISLGYKRSQSFYNIGAFSINYLYTRLEDNSKDSLSLQEILYLFDYAESNMWNASLSSMHNKSFAYTEIGRIQEWRRDFVYEDFPEVNYCFDSLTIVIHIRDCGEFGGHFEHIKIIKEDNHYIASFISDSIYCMNEPTLASDLAKYNGVRAVLPDSVLNSFITAFVAYQESSHIISNAPQELLIIQNKNVFYKDILKPWPKYINFRNEVFNF